MNKNLTAQGNLKPIPLFLLGGTLFSMHFGASSMVWPMNWGKESGEDFLLAFAGAFITSLLLVIVAYIALGKADGSFLQMSTRISNSKFATFYCSVTIVVLGPLYAIPRMSAAFWDSLVQATAAFGIDIDNKIYLVAFTVIFYLITYAFLINPGKAMDRISAILLPVLLIVVVAVVGKGVLTPIATPVERIYEQNPFTYGFTNGYATAEILCALIFGVVIFNSMANKGVPQNCMTKNMIRIGIIGIAFLTCTHFAHMWIGASTGGTIDLTYTALYTAVAATLFGKWGGVLFSIALFFAALTTSIGMTSGCASFFGETFNNRYSYKTLSIIMCVVATIFGSLGLTDMLTLLSPILDCVYPTAIILVLYYALVPKANTARPLYAGMWAVYVSFAFGVVDMIWKYMVKFDIGNSICDLYLNLPLADVSLAWVPWTILAFIIGWLTYRDKDNQTVCTTGAEISNTENA